MKRAYLATQTIEYIVVAESEKAAKELAVIAARYDYAISTPGAFDLSDFSHIPGIYRDEGDLIHHDGEGELTVADAAKLPGGYDHSSAPSEAP